MRRWRGAFGARTVAPMRPPRLLTVVLSALLLTLLGSLPAAASAAPQWRAAANGPANYSSDIRVAFDGSGNAVAVWRKSSTSGAGDSVWSAIAPAGSSTFGSTKRISATPASGETPEVSGLSLAIDAQGDVAVAWTAAYTAGAAPVVTVARRASGLWAPPIAISEANAAEAEVAFGKTGLATVAWSQEGGDYLQVRLATVATADGTVTPVQTIAPTSAYAANPQLAFDANGNGFITWIETKVSFSPPYTGTVTLRSMGRKAADATFTEAKQLYTSTTVAISEPDLAIDPAGNATATWNTTSESDGSSVDVYAATRLLGTTAWQGVRLATNAGSARVAASNRGGAVVTWIEQPADGPTGDETGVIKAARRAPATTSFMAPVRLSDVGELGSLPSIAAGAEGSTVVTWVRPAADGDKPRAAVMAAGTEHFWVGDDLDLAGHELGAISVGVGSTGDAVAFWQPSGTGNQRITRLDGATVSPAPAPEPDPAPTTPTATSPSDPTPSTPSNPSATTPSTTPSDPGTPSSTTPSTSNPGTPPATTPSTSNPNTPAASTPSTSAPSGGTTQTPSTGQPAGTSGGTITVAPGTSVAKTPTPPKATAARDTAAVTTPLPSLRSFKALTPKRFKAAATGEGLARRGDGLGLAVTGNYAGTLRLVVTSVPKNGRAKNLAPVLTYPVIAGTTKLVFTGRLSGKTLPAGEYRLKALFVDEQGRASNLRLLSIIIKR